jgi:hypothetical protein
MIKPGDLVKVLHVDGYGVVLWKPGDTTTLSSFITIKRETYNKLLKVKAEMQ